MAASWCFAVWMKSIKNYMSDKSEDAVAWKDLWLFCCFWFLLILLLIVNGNWLVWCQISALSTAKQTVAWESWLLDGSHSSLVAWEFFLLFISIIAIIQLHNTSSNKMLCQLCSYVRTLFLTSSKLQVDLRCRERTMSSKLLEI